MTINRVKHFEKIGKVSSSERIKGWATYGRTIHARKPVCDGFILSWDMSDFEDEALEKNSPRMRTWLEVHNMFDTILYMITILPGLDNTIMIIRVITS